MNEPKHRSPFVLVGRLIVLVKPMLPIMLAAIVMGVAGHFCATFITIFGGFGILRALGLASPLRSVGVAFACILVFALLRGILRYAEQASNHSIAFKLLALIRDQVFGALRRLTPAKLEGRDRGDLISLITADIEQLVFQWLYLSSGLEPSLENRSEPLQNRIAIRERINHVICKTSF